jgi:mannose-6-phosphate isomerase
MFKVVPKVWGAEQWIVNKDYCGKFLHLRKGAQCSLHYHERKDETFYVMVGLVLLELGDDTMVLPVGSIKHIPPGTKHRFTGIQDSTILEISTHDDDDNVRLEPSKVNDGSDAAQD